MPSLSARDYVQAKRGGRATSVRVQPTGTAVDGYQVALGNRHSLRPIGAVGAPAWSDRASQTETWLRVPRLSALCPRRMVVFDGGRGDINRTMEFGDEFEGAAVDTAKWDVSGGTPVVSGGAISLSGAVTNVFSKRAVSDDCAVRAYGSMSYADSSAFGFADSTSFNRYFAFNNDAGNNNQYTAQSFTGADTTSPLGTSYTGDHIWEVRLLSAGPSEAYLIDGISRAAHTRTVTYPLKPLLRTGAAAGSLSMRWLIVRKYVANEPLAGTARPAATNRALSRPMSHADLMRACCT